MRILLIDDDALQLDMLAAVLDGLGTIHTAQGGIQGLAKATKLLPDLILCDVMMPDFDGLEVCRHLRSHFVTKDIPILCLSAAINDEEEVAALSAGAVDFIKKPFNPQVVRARVRTQLELVEKTHQLHDLAMRDALTGAFNRRYFEGCVQDALANPHRRPLALGLIDLDRFKEYNLHYGSIKGDECLIAVAECLRGQTAGHGQVAARHGGDKFAFLLPGANHSAADAFGQGLCEAIRALGRPHVALPWSTVSVSVGIVVVQPDTSTTMTGVLTVADAMLMKAKSAGGDRHVVRVLEN